MFWDFESILLGTVLFAAFIGVVFALAKKQNMKDEDRVNTLTDEQKRILTTTPYELVENLPHAAKVIGLIHEIPKVTNSKVKLVIMYYNMYFPNMMQKILSVNINIPYSVYLEHNLKPGDYVKIIFNEDNAPKIVFN